MVKESAFASRSFTIFFTVFRKTETLFFILSALLHYLSGTRKSQPSFQREQPRAVLPRITVPLPHNGQTSPSFTFPGAAFGFATFFSRVFPAVEAFADFPFAGAAVHVTRLVFRSAITDATIWLTICFNSLINSVAEYSPRSISRSFFSHCPVSSALFSNFS